MEENNLQEKVRFILNEIISQTLSNKLKWIRSDKYGSYCVMFNTGYIRIWRDRLSANTILFAIYSSSHIVAFSDTFNSFTKEDSLNFFNYVESEVINNDSTINNILNELNNKK